MTPFLRGLTAAAVAVVAFSGAACQTSPERVDQPTPVVTSSTTATVADTQGVIPRLTNDIWPAINAYHLEFHQGSPGYQRLIKVIAGPEVADAVRTAAKELGQRRREDVLQGKPSSDSDLKLADTTLVESGPKSVVIQACYTYTVGTYGSAQPSVSVPAASEATVELSKPVDPRIPDGWYLYAITNDHVVQGCSGSNKV